MKRQKNIKVNKYGGKTKEEFSVQVCPLISKKSQHDYTSLIFQLYQESKLKQPLLLQDGTSITITGSH